LRYFVDNKLIAYDSSRNEPEQEATSGLESSDLHVRRTCRRLLDEILEADLRRRLDTLLADRDGAGQHDLPGWKRFQETIGDDGR